MQSVERTNLRLTNLILEREESRISRVLEGLGLGFQERGRRGPSAPQSEKGNKERGPEKEIALEFFTYLLKTPSFKALFHVNPC